MYITTVPTSTIHPAAILSVGPHVGVTQAHNNNVRYHFNPFPALLLESVIGLSVLN